mmetsp:Transcript_44800/g.124163  ORF Transcript_44800/g.124163 Transcript_44800/m.124163 type:complete len:342 (-) Transcript_44800:262-1287(-)
MRADSDCQPLPLDALRRVDAPLHDPTTMPVRGHVDDVPSHRSEDESMRANRKRLQTPLHYVVAVWVLRKRDHRTLEGGYQSWDVRRVLHGVDQLLDCSRSMHVECNTHQGGAHVVEEELELLLAAHVHNFLAQVVSERIHHEVDRMREYLVEDRDKNLCVALIELVLQHPAPSLVPSDRVHVADEGFVRENVLEVGYLEVAGRFPLIVVLLATPLAVPSARAGGGVAMLDSAETTSTAVCASSAPSTGNGTTNAVPGTGCGGRGNTGGVPAGLCVRSASVAAGRAAASSNGAVGANGPLCVAPITLTATMSTTAVTSKGAMVSGAAALRRTGCDHNLRRRL